MHSIRVVTFNIRHGRGNDDRVDLRRTARALAAAGGDLIGLQEVDKYTSRSGFCHQPSCLGHMLGKNWAFGANIEWLPGMEYGNAIMSKWPLTNYRNHLLPGSGEQRGLLEAVINTGTVKVLFFCTHLGLEYEDRKKQLERVMEITAASKKPLILAGDFNFERGSREFNVLSEFYQEATGRAGGVKTFPSGNPAKQPDFIFLSGHWRVISAQPVNSGASDHLAVVTEIELI